MKVVDDGSKVGLESKMGSAVGSVSVLSAPESSTGCCVGSLMDAVVGTSVVTVGIMEEDITVGGAVGAPLGAIEGDIVGI
jgi:hypothetical protein